MPFPIRGKTPSDPEKRQGAPWLRRLVDLLPNLEIVCLLGAPARDAVLGRQGCASGQHA